MYFDDLFTNFESRLVDYLQTNNIVSVNKADELVGSSYYHSFSTHSEIKLSTYFILSNPIKALQYLLNLDHSFFVELEYILNLLDIFFQNSHFKPFKEEFKHNSFMISKHYENNSNDCYIVILFNYSNLGLKITKNNGIYLKDSGGCVDKEPVYVDENNISSSFIEVLEVFKCNVLKMSEHPADTFDYHSVQKIKEMSIEEIINTRLKKNSMYKNFSFLSRDFLMNKLKPIMLKQTLNTVSTSRNGIIFNKNDIQFFLYSMKMMLNEKTYNNLERAVNFYHNYHLLMNLDYCIKMKIHINDKVNNANDIMKVSFGHDFIFDVALINANADKQFSTDPTRKTLFEIYRLIQMSSNKIGLIQTEDFSEFYDYVFKRYSKKISRIIEKPVADMTLDDAKILMMYNI